MSSPWFCSISRKQGLARPSPFVAVLALLACLRLAAAGLPQTGAVVSWNEIADQTSALAGPPPIRARITAMAQIAVHDALNAIHPRYATYTDTKPANAGASPEAAVATAAYVVLSQTVPSQADALAKLHVEWIAAVPACPPAHPRCIVDGSAAGEAAAEAILAVRSGDGSDTPHLPYTLPRAPGVYQPTPPELSDPQFAGWAGVTPFALTSGDQFRLDSSKIFDLAGRAYARDFKEVKRLGSTDAEAKGDRTPDQSAIARFWPGGGANWNAVTRVIVADRGLDMWQHARLFALLNMAVSDSNVAVFDTKYTHNFWRPVTAIREAATDGNPVTDPDPSWVSYQPTPPYPEYACGLTNNSGAAVAVLRRYFRTDALAYTLTAVDLTRSYTSLSQAAAESVDARVFGGMHFRTSCEDAVRQGRRVGRFVIRHYLQPLEKSRRR